MAQQAVGAGAGGSGFIFDPFYDDVVAGWTGTTGTTQPKTVLDDVFGQPNKMLDDFPFSLGGQSTQAAGFGMSTILLAIAGILFLLLLIKR